METHISWIFLVGDRTYKLKKPVDFGFVDYSTLDKRRHYCQEEVRLNRRLAPDLYLGTRVITEGENSLQLDGSGKPIDFVVEMRRFQQASLMANLEQAGKLTIDHVHQLARILANFHQGAPSAGPEDSYGTPKAVALPVDENFRHLLHEKASPEHRDRLHRLRDWARDEHRKRRAAFGARKANGRIRECHGDLHLGNIIVSDGAITLFDRIEFNEEFRWIDVMSDVAFCAMDLASRGHEVHAQSLLNSYFEYTGDYEGLAVLPYYLAYRAMVRAKVAWLRLHEAPEDRDELRADYEKHLALAEGYAFQRSPRLIIMHGLSGAGKSCGSAEIVKSCGAVRVRSDAERKRIAAANGVDDLYSAEMTRKTYDRLHQAAAHGLDAGFNVILDAAYLKENDRAAAFSVARQFDVPCRLIEVTAERTILERRIRRRQDAKNDPSDATVDVLRHQIASREPLAESERDDTLTVDTARPGCWDEAISRL